jgi:hypothetical protein
MWFILEINPVFCLSLWRRIFLMQEFARHVQEKMPVYLRFAIMGNHFDLMKIVNLMLLQQIAKMLSALTKKRPFFSLLFFFHKQNKNNYSIVANIFY